ncbi:MAG: TlpA disulfide reductase family protein [Lautropia sp.]|nr:TlpA disulfide reductase family protein [Lautropia sp.]
MAVALGIGTAQAADTPPAAAPSPAATEEAQSPLAQLAAFGWRDSNDQPFDLKQLAGKPVVINFWATWCAPCVKEMPALSALSADIGDKAAFLGISLDKLDKVKRFTDKTPVAYPLLIADFKGLGLSRQWGNKQGQMPYTVVLNAQGELHWQHAGLVDVEELRSMLKSAELR